MKIFFEKYLKLTENFWLVFHIKHKILKQNVLVFSFMEKMLIIQFHRMETIVRINSIVQKIAFGTYTKFL